jgi:hypothetical protein
MNDTRHLLEIIHFKEQLPILKTLKVSRKMRSKRRNRSTFSNVNKSIPYFMLLWILTSVSCFSLKAQDSVPVKKQHKNIIRFNLTNPMIFGEKSILLGYERLLGKNQSFSINGGRAAFPAPVRELVDSTLAVRFELGKTYKDNGFTFAFDYRFYLKKENRFSAPRGVYVGPYYNYTHFERENNWSFVSNAASGTIKTNIILDVQMIGAQMGYQFLFWNRVALDFILIGPGLAFYNIKTEMDTDLSEGEEAALLKILRESIATRFPAYDFVIDKPEFERSGSTRTSSLGFRYVIHLGYNF